MPSRRTFLMESGVAAVFAATWRRALSVAEPGAHSVPTASLKNIRIPNTDLVVSRIAYGCGSLVALNHQPLGPAEVTNASKLINTARECGISLFDHADLYGFGKSEEVFGQVLRKSPGLRNQIVIQSKCGQRFPEGWKLGDPLSIDLTRDHIVGAVEGSLRRLGTDRLDILLLHVADALVRPDEVARAFDELHSAGKVRFFGVSNHNATQIQLLKKSVRQPIVVNQIHLGLGHPDAIADGMEFALSLARPRRQASRYASLSGAGTMDYCRLQEIQIQAWSPLRGELLKSPEEAGSEFREAADLLADLAKAKQSTPSAVALAWLLRHPAGIVPVIGTGNPEHIAENCAAEKVSLSNDEWYALFAATAKLCVVA
jgi:predicted oxidoreductase